MAANSIPGMPAPDDGDQLIRRLEALEQWKQSFPQSVATAGQGIVDRAATLTTVVDELITVAYSHGDAYRPFFSIEAPDWASWAYVAPPAAQQINEPGVTDIVYLTVYAAPSSTPTATNDVLFFRAGEVIPSTAALSQTPYVQDLAASRTIWFQPYQAITGAATGTSNIQFRTAVVWAP